MCYSDELKALEEALHDLRKNTTLYEMEIEEFNQLESELVSEIEKLRNAQNSNAKSPRGKAGGM